MANPGDYVRIETVENGYGTKGHLYGIVTYAGTFNGQQTHSVYGWDRQGRLGYLSSTLNPILEVRAEAGTETAEEIRRRLLLNGATDPRTRDRLAALAPQSTTTDAAR